MTQKKKKINLQQPIYAIPGVKGFNKDLSCRDFQFKEGETFFHQGEFEEVAGE